VGCVLFSLNLVRSVYSSNDNQLDSGPGSSGGHSTKAKLSENRPAVEEPLLDYNTFEETGGDESIVSPKSETEESRSIFAILKTFTDYIRL
jgi:hypothetical protein